MCSLCCRPSSVKVCYEFARNECNGRPPILVIIPLRSIDQEQFRLPYTLYLLPYSWLVLQQCFFAIQAVELYGVWFAVMPFGSTDVDTMSGPSSFIILFSSIVSIKQDCSFDSDSESYQLLLCKGFEEWLWGMASFRRKWGEEPFKYRLSTV